MSNLDVGDARTLSIDFATKLGVPTNPTTVTLIVRKPSGTIISPVPTSTVVGRWESTIALDEAGRWEYRWQGIGVVDVVEEGVFYVRKRRF